MIKAKKRSRKFFSTRLLSFMLTLLTVISSVGFTGLTATAESTPQVYTVGNERTVFLSNAASVTYGGESYIPYTSLTAAFTALGADGGNAIVSGEFSPSDVQGDSGTSAFNDPSGRGTVTITGAVGAQNDTIVQKGVLFFKNGKVILDDITLDVGSQSQQISGKEVVITEKFKTKSDGSHNLLIAGFFSGNTTSLHHTIAGGKFGVVNFCGVNGGTIGSETALGYGLIEINGGDFTGSFNWGTGWGKQTVYGNLFLVVNGGNFSNKSLYVRNYASTSESSLNHVSGMKVAIFNSALGEGFTVADTTVPQYLVKSAAGGTVTVDQTTLTASAPRLIFTPNAGYMPIVDGTELAANADGSYSLTLNTAPTAAITKTVTWKKVLPQVYTIDGERTVFLSNAATVTYKSHTYVPYTSLSAAFAALGADGGKAIVSGEFTPDDNGNDGAFSDPSGRGNVTITGAVGAGSDKLLQSGTLFFKSGKVTFDDVTVKLNNVTKYFSGKELVFTEKFKTDTTSGNFYLTGYLGGTIDSVRHTVAGGTFNQMNLFGMNKGTLGSESKAGYALIEIDGGTVTSNLNWGSGYDAVTVYGNLFYIINGGTFSNKTLTVKESQPFTHASGMKVAIFNNGLGAGFTASNTSVPQYLIKSAAGGTVSVDQATLTAAQPSLILSPVGGRLPFVDGAYLPADADGIYRLKLSTPTNTQTIEITWHNSCVLTFDLNGGVGTTPASIIETANKTVSLPYPHNGEYSNGDTIFRGWSEDKNALDGKMTYTPQKNVTLYAVWVPRAPRLADLDNLEANQLASVSFDGVSLDDSENAAIKATADALPTIDPVLSQSAHTVLAFRVAAKDEGNTAISAFEHGIFAYIPDYVYTADLSDGESLRLYRIDGENARFVSELTPNGTAIPLTLYADGMYVLVKNESVWAQIVFEVLHADKTSVCADVYHKGAVAQGGYFGLKYDASALRLDGFTYANGVSALVGVDSCPLVTSDGIYAATWHTDSPAETVYIGRAYFEILGESSGTSYEISSASASESGFDAIAGFPTGGASSAYVPYGAYASYKLQPSSTIQNTVTAEARIGVTDYQNFSAALAAAKNGDTILLLKKSTLSESTQIPDGVTLSFTAGTTLALDDAVSLTTKQALYGNLFAATLVGVSLDEGSGVHTYRPSPYAKNRLYLDGVQIRVSGSQGLRFITHFNGNRDEVLADFVDFGILILPFDLAEYENTTLESDRRATISYRTLGDDFRFYSLHDTYFEYTVCLTEMPADGYDRRYTVRPYAVYTDGDTEYTVYADYEAKYNLSILDIANGLAQSDNAEYKALADKLTAEYNAAIPG